MNSFPNFEPTVDPCLVLTVASWLSYRFLRKQVRRQQLELDMEQQTVSKLGKEYITLLINLYAEYIMWNARLDEAQAGIKIAGRNTNNLRYADDGIFSSYSGDVHSKL